MGEYWIVVVITALIIGLIPAKIASDKGKDFLIWYIYGVCLFLFAMIHAIVLPEKSEDKQPLAQKAKESKIPLKDATVSNIYKEPLIVNLNCPIDLISYKIKVPEDYENAFANILFCNLSTKTIAATKLKLFCYDAFNEPIKKDGANFFEKSIQDLAVAPGENFGDEILIDLQEFASARKIKAIVTRVLFADDSIWNYSEDDLFELTTNLLQGEELAKLTSVAGEDAICYAREDADYWQCVCGRANMQDAKSCIRCKRDKRFVMEFCANSSQVDAALQSRRDKIVEEERKREEERKKLQDEQQAKAKATKQKRVKLAKIVIPAFILIIVAWFSITKLIMPALAYNNAVALMDAGDYEAAIIAFKEMEDYKDSGEKIEEMASKAYAAGDYIIASYAWGAIKEFKEIHKYLGAILDTISTGHSHTIGLKSDNSVVAIGNNNHGQCGIQGWHDIVAVSAGRYHTIALKADGSVVAVGNNIRGQCEVQDWQDIVKVSAGYNHTVGLKSDNSVVAIGNNIHGQCDVSGWQDIIAVSAGHNHTVALIADGSVVAVGSNISGQCNVSGWQDIIVVSAGRSHTVGLKSDGSVVAAGYNEDGQCNVAGWQDIVAVSAGRYHTVGLKFDGSVVAVGNNEEGQCDVSGWQDIIAVSAGHNHTVALIADGSVVAVGSNISGQCNVSGWQDIGLR